MKTLIIDTSTEYLFVIFYDEQNKEILFSKSMESHNNHSENLLVVIEEGLDSLKLELNDFDKVIVGEGPGSYTGLRIGMVVAKMITYTLNKSLYVISSLSLCVSGYLKNQGVIAVSSVAKKNYCYGKIFDVQDKINIVLNDSFLLNDDFMNMVEKDHIYFVNERNYKLDPEVIISLSEKVDNIHNVVPNYLRKANS